MMNIEEALLVVDAALEGVFLSNVQELVLRQSWEGMSYPEIAQSNGYEANYIKNVGYKLWKLLSQVFEEEVTKSNFRSVMRRQSAHLPMNKCNNTDSLSIAESENSNYSTVDRQSSDTQLYNTDYNATLEQQLLAVNIVKQCLDCPLITLSNFNKNQQELHVQFQVDSTRRATEACLYKIINQDKLDNIIG